MFPGNIVHCKDVLQQVIKDAFDHSGEDYEPHFILQVEFKKKWDKGIKRKNRTEFTGCTYMAAMIIQNKFKNRKKMFQRYLIDSYIIDPGVSILRIALRSQSAWITKMIRFTITIEILLMKNHSFQSTLQLKVK